MSFTRRGLLSIVPAAMIADKGAIYDSHVHIEETESSGSANAVTAERLLNEASRLGVTRFALVQKMHTYGFDNRLVVATANALPERFVAVCGIDGLAPKAFEQVHDLIAGKKAVAVRLSAPWSRGEPTRPQDVSWFAGDTALGVWQAARETHAGVVLHVYPWNRSACLAALAPLLSSFPTVRVVIDHLSNAPPQPAADFGFDAPLLKLMDHRRLSLKFSTINFRAWRKAGLAEAEVLTWLSRRIGADRLMWGSDFGNSDGDYADMIQLARSATNAFSSRDQRLLLYETAERFLRTRS